MLYMVCHALGKTMVIVIMGRIRGAWAKNMLGAMVKPRGTPGKVFSGNGIAGAVSRIELVGGIVPIWPAPALSPSLDAPCMSKGAGWLQLF